MIALAAVLGALWRRWWGDERPSWAPPKYRAIQAVVGFAVLFAIGWQILPWWEAAIRSGLALAFITVCAESIPHIWRGWEWVDRHWSMRSSWRLLDGYTTKGELTCGAIVWAAALYPL